MDLRTVIEFQEFAKKAEKELGADELEKIVSFISQNPKAGNKLEQFGGIRKLEWFKKGEKSELNIYYHAGTNNLPLVVIGMFRKNDSGKDH